MSSRKKNNIDPGPEQHGARRKAGAQPLERASAKTEETNPRQERRIRRNAGRAATTATGNVLPPAEQDAGAQENVQDKEAQRERRLELESRLRTLVIGHIMAKDVKKYLIPELGKDVHDHLQIDDDSLQDEIGSIKDNYIRNSGDEKDLDFILNLLSIDDDGAEEIATQLNTIVKGIENNSNYVKQGDLHSAYEDALYDESSMNIVSDLIRTGTARIAMADGNFGSMTLGAIPAGSSNRDLKEMPDDLTRAIVEGNINPYGVYGAGDKGIAANIIGGNIIHADYLDRLIALEYEINNVFEDLLAEENPADDLTPWHKWSLRASAASVSKSAVNVKDPYRHFIPGTDTHGTAANMPSEPFTRQFLANKDGGTLRPSSDTGAPVDLTVQPIAAEPSKGQSAPVAEPANPNEPASNTDIKPAPIPALVISSPDSANVVSPVGTEVQKSPDEIQSLLRTTSRELMQSGKSEEMAKSTLRAIFDKYVPLDSPDRDLQYRDNVLIPSVFIGVQRIVESMVKDGEELGGLGSFVSMEDGNIRLGNGIDDIITAQLNDNPDMTAQSVVDHVKRAEIRVVSNNQ